MKFRTGFMDSQRFPHESNQQAWISWAGVRQMIRIVDSSAEVPYAASVYSSWHFCAVFDSPPSTYWTGDGGNMRPLSNVAFPGCPVIRFTIRSQLSEKWWALRYEKQSTAIAPSEHTWNIGRQEQRDLVNLLLAIDLSLRKHDELGILTEVLNLFMHYPDTATHPLFETLLTGKPYAGHKGLKLQRGFESFLWTGWQNHVHW